MYSNSIDFGDYDYSGNPNLSAKLNASSFSLGTGATVADDGDEIVFTLDGTDKLGKYALGTQTPLTKGKQYTISCEIMLENDFTGDPSGICLQHAFMPGGVAVLQTETVPKNELNTWQKLIGTKTIEYTSYVPTSWYPIFRDFRSLKPSGNVRLRNIKIEEGSTATPYQPNLLDAPHYLSKVPLGENIANKSVKFPINASTYPLYVADMQEPYISGETYTATLKGTKPTTQTFAAYSTASVKFGDFKPVEGLKDVWSITFTVSKLSTSPANFTLYQQPPSTIGACQIDWLKIEKGNTRTPNISEYKYFGEGLKDSNNPNDYSWDIKPEYTEKGLNNTVSLTEPQSIEGLKNFEDGIQSKGKSVLTSDDMKTAVYTLTMSDVPDSTITELTGKLVRVNNDVTLRCRVNASAGTKVVFRVREGYRENIEDVWEIPLTAISQADHKNQVAYYTVSEANKREIKLVTVTAGNHFITGGWQTDDPWPTL